jgi:uncharacterized iron-regulated membrane protein
MSIASEARRLTYLIHRWTGVARCLLMLLWFASGIVMLFVGYPKLTPAEHLRGLPPLPQVGCCVPLSQALSHSADPARLRAATLTTIDGQPSYVLQEGDGSYRVVLAGSGRIAPAVDDRLAVRQASAFLPGAPAVGERMVTEDRWTHSRGLDAHRPLHAVRMGGASPATLYVSSATGQVVMDAPLAEQRWNYVGAWLHWLYMFRDRPVDPGWSWLVIVLSFAGTITAITGVCVGIWRWRFQGRYKSGSHSPYRAPWMRWHHIIGLLCAGFVCTWIFSGLMSMNPVGIFDARNGRPDQAAYRGGPPGAMMLPDGPAAALEQLQASGFTPVELSWRMLGGQPYMVAFDARGDSRLLVPHEGALSVRLAWSADEVLDAATKLFRYPIKARSVLEREDIYYYGRHAAAMNGGADRRLPALRLDFDDPDQTRVYINLRTGDTVLSLSQPARVGRWLFYFLHSWDTPWLLGLGAARDILLILLSLGGVAVSLTGVVIGIKRLRIWLRHMYNC